ncbi:hypothetical protein DFP74_6703 [Nocardiopsis sp. Huas11]|uniref:hypothetical protein n=1 Tax=Nocardiopsis sp. Huas11 TaxID=2183912 RepID=UPI000F176F4E|nr:hypothetical protein [Nocardiopsis sp. Huas11]RKR98982.1 hypothetical protein DFP74_6703 [Nocardiopsis sp. Huas11]
MSTVLFLAALAVLCTVTAVLLTATGGRDLIHAEHPLPEPVRHPRRAPKEG